MPKVSFLYADRRLRYPHKTALKNFISTLFQQEDKPLSKLSYIFCSDEYLLQVNRDFLQHDYYTDIITFDLSDTRKAITGEVYVSLDRVKENAITHAVSFDDELLRVVLHGALHLCGYGDKKKREITMMRNQEDRYMRLYLQTHFST